MRTKTGLRLFAVLAALALVAAACGDDDGVDGTGAPPAATDAPPPSPSIGLGVSVIEAPCERRDQCGLMDVSISGSSRTSRPGRSRHSPSLRPVSLRAFWDVVNSDFGIGGIDVVVTEGNTFHAQYDPTATVHGYTQIEPNVLMLAQSTGNDADHCRARPPRRRQHRHGAGHLVVGLKRSPRASRYGLVLEAGVNYCHEAMNDFDFALATFGPDLKYGLVYFPNDYGFDYSAGIKIAAAANGIGDAAVDHVQIPMSVGGAVTEAVGLMSWCGARRRCSLPPVPTRS